MIDPPRKYLYRLSGACCVLLLGACGGGNDPSLAELIGSTRWIEPRLSLDASHLCAAALEDGRCPNVSAETDRDLVQIARREHTLGDHQRALLHLLRGSDRHVPQLLLERHLASALDSAPAWSDLSAALLLGATDPYDWRALESAIVAAEEALELDAGYERAYFNLALAFGALALDEQALERWRDFRELAGSGPWTAVSKTYSDKLASEPRAHGDLRSSVAAADSERLDELAAGRPSEIRDFVFADAGFLRMVVTDRDGFCSGESSNWRLLGERVLEHHGDAFVLHAIEWICRTDDAATDSLLREVAQAVRWHDQAETGSAANAAERVRQHLKGEGGPFADLALVLEASAMLADPSGNASDSLLSPRLEGLRADYPWLAAWAYRILGTLKVRRAEHELAVDYFESGMAVLGEDGSRDPELSLQLKGMAAETEALAGRYAEAWRTGLDAIRGARETMSSQTLSALCEHVALIAAESGAHRLQESFSDCSIRHLADDESPANVVSAYIARAKARIALGNTAGANRDLSTARTVAAAVQDPGKRDQLLAYVDLNLGLTQVADHPAVAIETLRPVKAYFRDHENYEQVLAASAGIVDAHLSLGETRKADSELDDLGELVAQTQRSASTAAYSLPIHEHYRPVVERRVRLRLSLDDQAGALSVLLQARNPRRTISPDPEQMLAAVTAEDADQATLVLAWLGSDIAAWLLDESGIVDAYTVPASDARVLIARAAGTDLMPLPQGKVRALSELHTLLIEPIEQHLPSYRALRIVPDGVLFGIPFPALRDARTGRHLVQEIALTVSPDLAPPSLRTSRPRGDIGSVAIFVGSGLRSDRPLPALEAEARHIAGLFEESATVRTFIDVTSDEFLQALGAYDLLHFGGHGEVDLRAPLNSRLIVDGVGDSGAAYVTAQQLYDHAGEAMPRTVVLAACDTAAYTERLPHALALVRPLLERGAGEVVGSLRPIPDETYLAMMEMFYAELHAGRDAADALRNVQVRMARDAAPDDPGDWGYVQVYRYF